MQNIYRKVELVANLSIVAVAVIVVIVVVKNYVLGGGDSRNPANKIVRGSKIDLPDLDWGKNGETLLLVVAEGCHFCSESASFYQRLAVETAEPGSPRLIAVLPQEVPEGRKYLAGLGVSIDEVRKAQPISMGITGTPTLVLVDSAGRATDIWPGKLPPEKESEVLSRVQAARGQGNG
jgi:hypothetical protein